jgi:hypothetical protein
MRLDFSHIYFFNYIYNEIWKVLTLFIICWQTRSLFPLIYFFFMSRIFIAIAIIFFSIQINWVRVLLCVLMLLKNFRKSILCYDCIIASCQAYANTNRSKFKSIMIKNN